MISHRFIIAFSFLILTLMPAGFAATYDIKEMTPQVQQALHSRQERYETLQSLKTSGAVGENSRGYVEALSNEGNAASVVSQENSDRKIIYRTIVEQNHLGPSGLSQVETVFAEVQRDKAHPGESIQTASGQWIQK